MISRRGFLAGMAAAIAGFNRLGLTPRAVASLDHLSRAGRDEFERTGVIPETTSFGPLVDDGVKWAKATRAVWPHEEYLPYPSSPVWRS